MLKCPRSYFSLLILLFFTILTWGEEGLAQTGQSAGYSLTTSAAPVSLQGTVTVSWQAPSTHAGKDWIGLFPVGMPNKSYITWKFVPSGTSGTMTFKIPSTTIPQAYEFRYLLNNGYVNTATSNPITITSAPTAPAPTVSSPVSSTTPPPLPTTSMGSTPLPSSTPSVPASPSGANYALAISSSTVASQGTVTVSWQAPSTHAAYDWIGLFLVGMPSTASSFATWKFVPSGTSGTMTFTMPNTWIPQVYEFRYLLNNGYVMTAKSNPITITRAAAPLAPTVSSSVPSSTTPPPPPVPTSPSITTPSLPGSSTVPAPLTSATLTWGLSPSSDVAGYKVYRSTASSQYGAPLATLSGAVTTYQATGLQLNTTYYFVITAYDQSNNESLVSNEVSKSIY